jgi:hypothetical protein
MKKGGIRGEDLKIRETGTKQPSECKRPRKGDIGIFGDGANGMRECGD